MRTDRSAESREEAEAEPREGAVPDPSGWLDAHGDALYRFARLRVSRREIAEDLVQETLLAALRSLDRFRGDASPRTWLLAILRRKIADLHRRGPTEGAGPPRKVTYESLSQQFFDSKKHWSRLPCPWKTPLQALEDDEFWLVFESCMAHLPRHLAEAFLFREVEGIEIARLGAVLETGAANVRVRLHRARLLLRACLEKNWFRSEPETMPRPS